MENKIKNARYAGILYLLIAIISPIAIMYIPSQLIVNSDITETIKNILDNQFLFRLGIGIETIICLLEVVLSVLLYKLFKEVNDTFSTIALVSRLSMTIIQSINALASLTVIGILTSSTMNSSDVKSVIFALLKYKELGVMIWQIFFGLHLIILGYLVYKSNYVARFFGILLSISSLGYLADSYFTIFQLNTTIFSTIGSLLLVISTIGEVAITFRFLFKKIVMLSFSFLLAFILIEAYQPVEVFAWEENDDVTIPIVKCEVSKSIESQNENEQSIENFLADLTSIEVKNSTLYVGDSWNSEDNFVSATDYLGNPLTVNSFNITGLVDTTVPGEYSVLYFRGVPNRAVGTYFATAIITVIEREIPTYNARYTFISGATDQVLPTSVTDLLPSDTVDYENGATVVAIDPTETTVITDEGTWTFQGWDTDTKIMDNDNVIFTGTWTFKTNEPDTQNIPDKLQKTEKAQPHNLPQTGDTQWLELQGGVFLLSGIALLVFKIRKQK